MARKWRWISTFGLAPTTPSNGRCSYRVQAAVALITALALIPDTAAASRVVVTASEPVQWAIDGVVVPSCVTCTVRNPPCPSRQSCLDRSRPLEAHAASDRLVVADGSDVRVQWSRGEPFVLSGARTDNSAVPEAVVSGPRPAPNGSSGATASLGGGPWCSWTSRCCGSATERGASGVGGDRVRGCRGCGWSGIERHSLPDSGAKAGTRLARHRLPATRGEAEHRVGAVTFIKASGDAIVIYEDGMVVAQLGARGGANGAARGGSSCMVFARAGPQLLFSDLTVRQRAGVRLEVSESSPPVALDRVVVQTL